MAVHLLGSWKIREEMVGSVLHNPVLKMDNLDAVEWKAELTVHYYGCEVQLRSDSAAVLQKIESTLPLSFQSGIEKKILHKFSILTKNSYIQNGIYYNNELIYPMPEGTGGRFAPDL